ncbi:MAG TPA: protein-glutamate O-methyltransferase CheR [Spirochaetota bacterium]|nr:protein-glutamate O-methyltransferase CheR [Spirochaetota bacterium]
MALEHARLVAAIHKLTEVYLEDDKLYLLDSRLGELLKKSGVRNWDDAAQKLEAGTDKEFIDGLVDRITTHETRFFRDESIFDALVMQIIPEWLKRNGLAVDGIFGNTMNVWASDAGTTISSSMNPMGGVGAGGLKIWCAACSTGQEPYSIAMMLAEKMPRVSAIASILASDISQDTLRRAREGVYTRFEIDRGLPENYRKRYFTADGEKFRINETMRNAIVFRPVNLISDPFPTGQDIIFCRNVSIYFTEEQKKILYRRLKEALKPDGILVLGSAESLSGYLENFVIREFGLARYYEVNASGVYIFKRKSTGSPG